ncbi:MAG: glutathione S-transferase N-terminal domain-containing protein [Betaproteobacteria bacterium]
MKLYASPGSSFARKIRVMMLEKNVSHEVVLLNLWEPNDYQTVNPIGKVPALKLDDGRVLINSPLIADYVDGKYPSPRFIPADPDARLEVRRWEAVADGAMDAIAASMYETRFHDEAARSQVWLDRQRGKIDAGLAALDGFLGNRAWLVGDTMSLADLAIACHLGFVSRRAPQYFPQERFKNLARLCKTMEARESMQKTAPPPA